MFARQASPTAAHTTGPIDAGIGATVRLAQTEVFASTTALASTGNGVIQGWPDNAIGDNTTNGIAPTLLNLI